MFYCDTCAEDRQYPQTPFKSKGQCELCNSVATCNDFPSHRLPEPGKEGPTKTEIEAALQSIAESPEVQALLREEQA